MNRITQSSALLLLVTAILPGCQSMQPQNQLFASRKIPDQPLASQAIQTKELTDPSDISTNEITPANNIATSTTLANASSDLAEPGDSGVPDSQQSPENQKQAMAEVLDKLHAIEAIDPVAKKQLMADLQEAKPKHWSLIVQQFQAALAFRQHLVDRESKIANQNTPEHTLSDSTLAMSTDLGATEHHLPTNPAQPSQDADVPDKLSYPSTDTSTQLVSSEHERSSDHAKVRVSDHQEKTELVRLTPPPIGKSVSNTNRVESASYQSNTTRVDKQTKVEPTTDLDRAIAELEKMVTDEPANMDDIHDQVNLRLLYLLAGRQEDALRPIPGATPAQQDYWSKQLFAMGTFLDSKTQPDIKKRASAALAHLDDAHTTLSELAALQVVNLSFVTSVEGFGDYQLQQQTTFKPLEQVTLYAEVENFRSESTEKGYRTALGTSYQVVDANGNRVDGGQFPEVLDLCKNRRRDFHIQYGIALPARIYAGSYELQLIVTDNKTGKIGQATLPFEIVE